jgi:transposase
MSRANVAHVADMHANPYIALATNAKSASVRAGSYRSHSMAWRWLWHLYNLHRDEFLAKYHARSNAESTFSGIKRVFGDSLRSKTRMAQTNELLLKVICWNITCLIHSIFGLGSEMPRFGSSN